MSPYSRASCRTKRETSTALPTLVGLTNTESFSKWTPRETKLFCTALDRVETGELLTGAWRLIRQVTYMELQTRAESGARTAQRGAELCTRSNPTARKSCCMHLQEARMEP